MQRSRRRPRLFFTWRGFFVLVAVVFVVAAAATLVVELLGHGGTAR